MGSGRPRAFSSSAGWPLSLRGQPVVVPVVADPAGRAEGEGGGVDEADDADGAVDAPAPAVGDLDVGDVAAAVGPAAAGVLAELLLGEGDDLALVGGAIGNCYRWCGFLFSWI